MGFDRRGLRDSFRGEGLRPGVLVDAEGDV